MRRKKHLPTVEDVMEIASDEEREILNSGTLADPEVYDVYMKLVEKWEDYRILEVENGTMVVCRGNTYPVRGLLKEYGLHWDSFNREWSADLTVIGGAKMLVKLAREINAEIRVNKASNSWINRASPKKAEEYDKITEIAKKYGEFDLRHARFIISQDSVRKAWDDLSGRRV